MTVPQTIALPPARVLLLIALLLAGRSFLASHHYEHDLVQAETECDVCEFFHASKDDEASVVIADPHLAAPPLVPISVRGNRISLAHSAYRPRAPPHARG
ncbi:MAG: hypothetical protein GTO67_09110 [Gammaproteobacteria bacterium]|nr:hypothetical protein [Gammaproteobacteria bacterium]NIM73123.1 hypothetical protein [Gammaproteobacteria bacterium]NIN38803.1 hypothetical protein [Gammaproteobacteria bacterium]NIO24878.1 hypothetical protein [Gammaproteobacteria bacterium]NIO65480.1 hypothetical protein [Gammaproteobacteria bacterium]